MRGEAAPLRQRLAGTALRAAAASVRRLPSTLAYALADLASLAVVLYALGHERRVGPQGRGLFRNQRIVFRERLTRSASWALLFAWARHLARLAVDFCRMPRIDAANLARHVDFRALAELRKLHAEGRGVICVSGHIGVWELLGHAARLEGLPVSIVARRMPQPPLHDLVDFIRRHAGQEVIEQRGALWHLKKALDRGRVIGLLADEDTPEKPIFVPFLGTLAASSRAAALLQRVSGAPIAVVGCHRVGRDRFRIDVWRVIPYAGTRDTDPDPTHVTAAIAEALSRAILARPEQWLWGSRRYLTRPAGEQPGPDGLPPRVPKADPHER